MPCPALGPPARRGWGRYRASRPWQHALGRRKPGLWIHESRGYLADRSDALNWDHRDANCGTRRVAIAAPWRPAAHGRLSCRGKILSVRDTVTRGRRRSAAIRLHRVRRPTSSHWHCRRPGSGPASTRFCRRTRFGFSRRSPTAGVRFLRLAVRKGPGDLAPAGPMAFQTYPRRRYVSVASPPTESAVQCRRQTPWRQLFSSTHFPARRHIVAGSSINGPSRLQRVAYSWGRASEQSCYPRP